jgi:hypothetical protein
MNIDNTENNKPKRLTVSYSRKFNLGNYESQDISVFTSWDAETDNPLEEQKKEIQNLKSLVNEMGTKDFISKSFEFLNNEEDDYSLADIQKETK